MRPYMNLDYQIHPESMSFFKNNSTANFLGVVAIKPFTRPDGTKINAGTIFLVPDDVGPNKMSSVLMGKEMPYMTKGAVGAGSIVNGPKVGPNGDPLYMTNHRYAAATVAGYDLPTNNRTEWDNLTKNWKGKVDSIPTGTNLDNFAGFGFVQTHTGQNGHSLKNFYLKSASLNDQHFGKCELPPQLAQKVAKPLFEAKNLGEVPSTSQPIGKWPQFQQSEKIYQASIPFHAALATGNPDVESESQKLFKSHLDDFLASSMTGPNAQEHFQMENVAGAQFLSETERNKLQGQIEPFGQHVATLLNGQNANEAVHEPVAAIVQATAKTKTGFFHKIF